MVPEAQRAGEKKQKQEIEDEGKGERNEGEGGGVFSQSDTALPRQMVVCRDKMGNPMLR